jgi:hypothetical protein
MNDDMEFVELERFPEYLNGYNGIVCQHCNTVFYGPKHSKIIELQETSADCPLCGGENTLHWIMPFKQPKGERDLEKEEAKR